MMMLLLFFFCQIVFLFCFALVPNFTISLSLMSSSFDEWWVSHTPTAYSVSYEFRIIVLVITEKVNDYTTSVFFSFSCSAFDPHFRPFVVNQSLESVSSEL